MIPISRKPYTDLVCILCLVLMLALVIVYRNGEKLGIQPLEKQQALSDLSASAVIALSDEKIRVKGSGAFAEDGVITVAYGGEYTFTGQCSDARILVQADKKAKVKLIFDNAELTARNAPVIFVANAGKTTLQTAKDSENILRSLGELDEAFVSEEIDGGIFSKDDLILDGKGSLTLTADSAHGIVSKDDLDLRGGDWTVEAALDGLRGRDSIELEGGSYAVTCGGDGLKSNNDVDENRGSITISGGALTVHAGQDGIQAYRDITVSGGALDITTGGGHGDVSAEPLRRDWIRPGQEEPPERKEPPDGKEPPDREEPPDLDEFNDEQETLSQKGIKAGAGITITGGSLTLNCRDDGIHSDGTVSVTGGALTVESGDDAMHANESIRFEGASLLVPLCVEGIEAQRIDILSGSIDVTAVNDGINANGLSRGVNMSRLAIAGGSVKIHAEGDGMDSNGDIIITGGTILVSADPSDGNSAVDYGIENGGDCTISGGSIVACGFAGMAEMFSEQSTQCSILYAFEEAYAGGTEVGIYDGSGKLLLSFAPENLFDCVIFSCDALRIGESYTIRVGADSVSVTPDSVSGRYGETLQRPEMLPPHDPGHMGGFGGPRP